MTNRFFCLLPSLVASALIFSCQPAGAQESLRVLSYNVRNCRGLDDYQSLNVVRIAGVVSNQAPDVVALQELDRKTKRNTGRDVLQELAAATGMTGTYGEAIPFQGGSYGVGILSKNKPLRSYHLPLPGKEEARALLVCEFDTFVFFCTHLSLTAESRLASVGIINREQATFSKPVLLAGDFNAEPDSAVVQEFGKSWKRVSPLLPTFPADKPDRTIDYIFVSGNTAVQASESRVVNEPVASDHRPVFSRVSFK